MITTKPDIAILSEGRAGYQLLALNFFANYPRWSWEGAVTW